MSSVYFISKHKRVRLETISATHRVGIFATENNGTVRRYIPDVISDIHVNDH